jgi:hypothetical protein
MYKKLFGAFLLTFAVMSTSCNRGSGCPANEQMAKMGMMSPGEIMQQKQKKKKHAGPKSSVLPAEVKYAGKSKSKKKL